MKKFIVLVVAVMMAAPIFAQRGIAQGQYKNNHGTCMTEGRMNDGKCALNLTEEQQAQMTKFRAEKRKAAKEFRLEMNVLRAEYQRLMASESASEKEIDAKIDQMNSLRVKHQKANYRHMKKVRNILNDEQKEMFDARRGERFGRGDGSMGNRGKRGCGRGSNGSNGAYGYENGSCMYAR